MLKITDANPAEVRTCAHFHPPTILYGCASHRARATGLPGDAVTGMFNPSPEPLGMPKANKAPQQEMKQRPLDKWKIANQQQLLAEEWRRFDFEKAASAKASSTERVTPETSNGMAGGKQIHLTDPKSGIHANSSRVKVLEFFPVWP